jgi:hypothetical protein
VRALILEDDGRLRDLTVPCDARACETALFVPADA